MSKNKNYRILWIMCVVVLLTACGNDHRTDTMPPDTPDTTDASDSGLDTDLTENPDTTTTTSDSGDPDASVTPDTADTYLGDTDEEADLGGDPADTAPDDTSTDTDPTDDTDTEEPDTEEPDTGETDTTQDTDPDVEELTQPELWERECNESVRIYCDQVFDSACDDNETTLRARSFCEMWNPNLEPYDACIDLTHHYYCSWLEEPALGDEVTVDVDASIACNAAWASLTCTEYVDLPVRNALVECDPVLVGTLSHGDPCTVHAGCPPEDYCEGSRHVDDAATSGWVHTQGVCVTRLAEGQACATPAACRDGLTCADQDGVRICVPEA